MDHAGQQHLRSRGAQAVSRGTYIRKQDGNRLSLSSPRAPFICTFLSIFPQVKPKEEEDDGKKGRKVRKKRIKVPLFSSSL